MAHSTGAAASRDEEALRKTAVRWYVRLCSGEASAADHLAWQQWHAAHPDHQRAWQRIESIRNTTQGVPAAIARPTLAAANERRRHVLRSLVLLGSLGAFSYGAYRVGGARTGVAPWASLLADFRTATGKQRELDLADGSRMVLNTGTAVDVSFDGAQRLVRLLAGEVLIETAKRRGLSDTGASQDSRPFMVETAHGSIRALGTRFIVRDDDARTRVTVLQDSVEVTPADGAGGPVLLRAGQQLSFSRHAAMSPGPADPAADAWTQGSLVVNDWRLGDVITELARYHTGHLACDAAVSDIRVSGAFPIHDTDKALAVIMRAFPVRVLSLTRYWIKVVPV
ncbi:DUF4880 domain-containing protein [Pigmentiphaga aceris]|uniref:DUF4880 domain-containing protein n=1 Tax=Pigmentiphaga aceris TaxID=1940612 RepID=A0A5C0AW46_9BURK|nr:FecR domain-containing protein [Pigmentiphaga aceris]QEI06455.1 DUF4880 domain-containing protein [Pigmentiphaga aceris]